MESLTEQLSSQKFHDSLTWEHKIIEKVKASFKGFETKSIVVDKLLSSQTVAELGVVIFNALDFGLKVPLLVFFYWNLI